MDLVLDLRRRTGPPNRGHSRKPFSPYTATRDRARRGPAKSLRTRGRGYRGTARGKPHTTHVPSRRALAAQGADLGRGQEGGKEEEGPPRSGHSTPESRSSERTSCPTPRGRRMPRRSGTGVATPRDTFSLSLFPGAHVGLSAQTPSPPRQPPRPGDLLFGRLEPSRVLILGCPF